MHKRFIVVDPSFTSHDGDRWQYAVDLARSARERGYSFVMLTHRDAPSIWRAAGFPIRQRRIFGHAFYEHDKVYERHRTVGQSDYRTQANLHHKDLLDGLERRRRVARSRRDSGAEHRITQRIKRARRNRWRSRIASLSAFAPIERARPFNRDDFAEALAAELRRLDPGPRDVFFFHTMTYGMMESLSEVTAALDHRPPFDTQAYFLFHFGAEAPDARTFLDRYYSYSSYGSIADRMKVGSPFRRLHFLCTCEPLRVEAERILGAPVTIWHGLVNQRYVEKTLGGLEKITERRAYALAQVEQGEVRVLVRAADLDAEKARAVSQACHLAQHRGNVTRLRVIYHRESFPKLRDIVSQIDFPNLELIKTERNETYLREVCDAGIVLLTYDEDKYEKRVSAVLHDCAVLGVPALVPEGTTLAECDYAPKFVYDANEGLVGALLNAIRHLQRRGRAQPDLTERARALLAGNAVDRLFESSPRPSLERMAEPAPLANVVMPLWGRVGSSFAMEAQIRFLVESGYFVNQVFLMDKPVDPLETTEYFWKMLRENSVHTRGSIQRIAFRTFDDNSKRLRGDYLKRGAFGQLLRRYALNRTEDSRFDAQLRRARLTVVNHVFHTEWALRHTGGRKILETHDIQSYQMINWPLINEATRQPDGLSKMLAEETASVRRYDQIVNVAPEEHTILQAANPRAMLVTPYLPEVERRSRFATVSEMAWKLDLPDTYRRIDNFDLLIVGDAHPANCDSVIWFVEKVFVPYLAPLRYNLVLVGRVSDAVRKALGNVPFVLFLGFVEDLESVKALSRLAILPDRYGTGISIKTLEAMASGMPFVATSVALRGLRARLPDGLTIRDEPRAMADAIMTALNDPATLARLAALSHEAYERVAGKKQYSAAWTRVLEAAFTPPPSRVGKVWRDVKREVGKRWRQHVG